MKSPITGKEMSVHKEWRKMKFRREEFSVLFHTYLCEDTGEKFEDEIFAELNFNQTVNQYRAKYIIPTPEKISQIREQFGLPATKMSIILGLGVNSYRQYEAGEIPSQSNARLIQIAEDPKEFKRIVELSTESDQKTKEKIFKRIDLLVNQGKKNRPEKNITQYFWGDGGASSNTGFRVPDLNKLSEMIVFFAEKLQPWKTKLNKLLFYSDFSFFKKTAFSISGTPYIALSMGPVPVKFNSIYEYLIGKNTINVEFTIFKDGGIGERFSPDAGRTFNPAIFSKNELEMLESIAKKFAHTSTQEIIQISHLEKAWIDNKDSRAVIDYRLSFELNDI